MDTRDSEPELKSRRRATRALQARIIEGSTVEPRRLAPPHPAGRVDRCGGAITNANRRWRLHVQRGASRKADIQWPQALRSIDKRSTQSGLPEERCSVGADNTRAHNHRSHGRAGDERAEGGKSVEAVLCVCRDAEGKIVECGGGKDRGGRACQCTSRVLCVHPPLGLLRGVRDRRHAAVGVASRPAVHDAGHLGAHHLAAAGRRRQHAAQERRVGGRQERVAPRGRRRGGT